MSHNINLNRLLNFFIQKYSINTNDHGVLRDFLDMKSDRVCLKLEDTVRVEEVRKLLIAHHQIIVYRY